MEELIVTEWWGVTIFRPNNLITNIILGIVGVTLAYLLYRAVEVKNEVLHQWVAFLGLIGIGGTIGGFAHAFNYEYPGLQHTFIHKISWTIGGLGMYGAELGSISLLPNKYWRKFLGRVFTVKLLIYIFLQFYTQVYYVGAFNHFWVVQANIAFVLLGVVVPCHLYDFIKRGNPGFFFIIGGILSLTLSGICYNWKISLTSWFDYNDISHFVEILCIALIYLGVKSLHFNRPIQIF